MKILKLKELKEKLLEKKIVKKWLKTKEKIDLKVRTNLRYELIFLIGSCFLVSLISGILVSNMIFVESKKITSTNIGIDEFESNAKNFAESLQNGIEEGKIKLDNSKYFNEMINGHRTYTNPNHKIYVIDLEGNVIYKNENGKEVKFSIFKLLSSVNETQSANVTVEENFRDGDVANYTPQSMTKVFPLNIEGTDYYIIYEGVPEFFVTTTFTKKANNVLGILVGTTVFVIMFLLIINKKVKYLDRISDEIKVIASGDLSHRVEVRGIDEVSNIAENINLMAEEIEAKIKSERKAEKTKAELITNVSHDLRTPLTSIMGYIGLLKDKRYTNEKEMEEYLDIAFNKSEKLKILIEDLFEYTKLNNAELKLEKTIVNVSSLVSQIADEMTPVFEENDLMLLKNVIDEKILCEIDPDKIVRVFENILSNACKYSYKPGTVVIGVYENEDSAIISVRNRGESIPKEKLNKLFDRFYRGDESRTAESGGTGLGLAIAKNIVNMHGGHLFAECSGNDITFYIKLAIYRN